MPNKEKGSEQPKVEITGTEVFSSYGKVDFTKDVITTGVSLISSKGPVKSVASMDRSMLFFY